MKSFIIPTIMDKVLTGIVSEISLKYNISTQEVERVLVLPYKMMREKIQALELNGHTYDEVMNLKTNFNMPVLFKLYLNQYKLNHFNKKKEDAEEQTED